MPRDFRNSSNASATSSSASTGPASSSRNRSASGPESRNAYSTGNVCTPSRRSVPGTLPDSSGSLSMSMMSSQIWNAVPTIPPILLSRSICSSSEPENVAPNRPDAAIRHAVFSYTTLR